MTSTPINMRRKTVTHAWAGMVALLVLVLLQNLLGGQLNQLTLRAPGIDKAMHFVEYAFMYVAIHWLTGKARVTEGVRPVPAWTAALAIALIDEAAQQWGPGRNVEALDVAADVCGIAFGWALIGSIGLRRATVAAVALVCAAYVTYDSHLRTRDFARGLRYEREHDFQSARIHYLRALAAGVKTPALFNSLGWVEIESGVGDPAKAVEYARRALDMRPDDPDVHDTYGWALHHAGRNVEALEHLQRAYTAKPRMFCIHYHLGSVYLALGRREVAEVHFRQQAELLETREAAMAVRTLEAMAARQ